MLLPSIVALAVSGTVAVAAALRRRRALLAIFKPSTTILLFAVLGRPGTPLARMVAAGIGLSLLGDVALLFRPPAAFLVGLGAFLLAHLLYTAAFVWTGAAVWSPGVAIAAVPVAAATALLLRAIWRGAAGMHAPTVLYGLALSAMVLAAWATLAGPLPGAPLAAGGAILFYVSDASLALNRFRRPIRRAEVLTLGLYWAGQLGIVLAARGPLR